MKTNKKKEKLRAIVEAALYLQNVNKEFGCVPDCALDNCNIKVEEARQIRDIIQELK